MAGFSLRVCLLICLVLAAGCASVPTNPKAAAPGVPRREIETVPNTTHIVVVQQRPEAPRIHWYQKLNPVWWFGNIDDPEPPDDYRPGENGRIFRWRMRNLLHNFDSYVIGVSDRTTVRSGSHPARVFNPDGGWNFAVSRVGLVLLPFVSYHDDRFEWYFGWRISGNFGIALRRNEKQANL